MFNKSKYLLTLATLVSGVLTTSPAAADSPMTGHQGQQQGSQQVNSGGSRHGGSSSGQRNDRGSHDNRGDGRHNGGGNARSYANDRGHDGRGDAGRGNPGYGGWGQRAVYGLPAYRGYTGNGGYSRFRRD